MEIRILKMYVLVEIFNIKLCRRMLRKLRISTQGSVHWSVRVEVDIIYVLDMIFKLYNAWLEMRNREK